MRNLTRRKNQQHPARPQVFDCLLQGAPVHQPTLGVFERIDEDADARQFGQRAQQLIGQYADVGASPRQQVRKHDTVQNAEWMVRNRDYRTALWNLFEIGGSHVHLNLKIFEEPPHKTLLRARPRVQIFETIDLQEMIDSARQLPWQTVGGKCFECHSSA